MDWADLFVALSLVLVLEGILPFANPGGYRRAVENLSRLNNAQLRMGGGVAMAAGVVLLYLVH